MGGRIILKWILIWERVGTKLDTRSTWDMVHTASSVRDEQPIIGSQSVNQSVSESIIMTITQSVNYLVNQLDRQSVSQLVSQLANLPVRQLLSQLISHSVN
jgi:hypothetical protein